MTKKTKDKTTKDKVDANLDAALAATFPASDPPAMTEPGTGNHLTPKRAKRPRVAS
jgi:hypothetical protein